MPCFEDYAEDEGAEIVELLIHPASLGHGDPWELMACVTMDVEIRERTSALRCL